MVGEPGTVKAPKAPRGPRRARVPTVLQMEAVECGAACLSMVLAYHGRFVPLEEVRIACGVSRDGSKASNVLKAARVYGLEGKGYKRELGDLRSLAVPAILFWNFNHFVVLEGVGRRRAWINDPAAGRRAVSLEELDAAFTGVVLTFTKGTSFRREGRPPSAFASLRGRLRGARLALAFVVLAGLGLVVPGLVVPVFTQVFVDKILVGGLTTWLGPLVLGLLVTAFARAALTWLQSEALRRLMLRITVASSARFMWHLLRLPVEFFSTRYPGELARRVSSNASVAQALSGDLASAILALLRLVFFAWLMTLYDPWLTALTVAFGALGIVARRVSAAPRRERSESVALEEGRIYGVAVGGLAMIETLQSTGGEGAFFSRWAGHHAKVSNAQQRMDVTSLVTSMVPDLLTSLATVAILAAGALRVMDGELTMGMLVAFQSLAASFLEPVERLVGLAGQLQQVRADMTRLDDVLRYAPELDDKGEHPRAAAAALTQRVRGEVELRGMSFGYSRLEAPLLRDLSLRIPAGHRVALVGSSGSGKSTVARLVAGLYHPWSGEILIDGRPREVWPRAALARRLGRRSSVDAGLFTSALRGFVALTRRTEDGVLTEAVEDPTAAAVAVAARADGFELTPAAAPAGVRGLDAVRSIARAARIQTREVALRGRWWRTERGPLVGFLEQDLEPVALVPGARGLRMVGAGGVRRRLTASVAALLHPMAVQLYRPLPDRPLSVWDVARFALRGTGADLRRAVLLALAASLVGLVTPAAMGLVFEEVVPNGDRSTLAFVAIGIAAAALAQTLFGVVQALALTRVEARAAPALQAAVWDRVLRLPARFFRRYAAADLALRVGAIEAIRQMVSTVTLQAVLSGLLSVSYLILLVSYDATLAVAGLGLVTLTLLLTAVGAAVQLRRQRAMADAESKQTTFVMQLVTGVARLRDASAEHRAFARWGGMLAAQARTASESGRVSSFFASFDAAGPLVTPLVVFTMAVAATGRGLGTGEFIAFHAAFGAFLGATLSLGDAALRSLSLVPAWERARPILETVPESGSTRPEASSLEGAVELSRVCFRYTPDGPPILDEVTIEARPGELVAIVGPSGSGKSTLLRILLGFETPESGAVYYDGQDLAGVDLQSVRRQIGVVLQHGTLMAGDLYTNIAGPTGRSLEEAWEAARLAGLDRDIKAMPMGMHTVLMDGGGTLSGGQKQRLMIARALVGRPRIMVLDEATSALDNRSQALVTQSLDALAATRIVIAHRLITIAHADRIYVLDKGRVVESGRMDALLAAGGTFAALARRQMA